MTTARFEDADAAELRRRIDDALMDLHYGLGVADLGSFLVSERIRAAIETLKVGAPGIEAVEAAAHVAAYLAAHPEEP